MWKFKRWKRSRTEGWTLEGRRPVHGANVRFTAALANDVGPRLRTRPRWSRRLRVTHRFTRREPVLTQMERLIQNKEKAGGQKESFIHHSRNNKEVVCKNEFNRKEKNQHTPKYYRSSSTLETSRLGAFDFETTNIGAVIGFTHISWSGWRRCCW